MIEARRRQRSFGDGLIAEEIEDLQETWMRHVDVVLQDEEIVSAVHETRAAAMADPLPSRSRVAPADPEARSQLELRGSGA